MAATFITFYNSLRTELVKRKGACPGAIGPTGSPLPRTSPTDLLAILSVVYVRVESVIRQNASSGYADKVPSWNIDHRAQGGGGRTFIGYDTWFRLGLPIDGVSARCRRVLLVDYGLVDPIYKNAIHLEHLMSKWNVAIKRAGIAWGMIALSPGDLDPAATVEAWKAIYALLIAMELAGEQPTPELMDRILAGIKYAAVETVKDVKALTVEAAHVAGQVVGHVAQTAGEAAGQVAHGFFRSAGLTAWIVVGGAIYLAATA